MDKTLLKLKKEVTKLVQDVVDSTGLKPVCISINYAGSNYADPIKVQGVSIALENVE